MRKKILLSTALLVSSFAAPQLAMAQDPGHDGGDVTLEDIVVTARKTSELLQTTPVAVTALNTSALEKAQIISISDLRKSAPSLVVNTGGPGGPGTIYLAMRGQVNNSGNSTSDSAVATYVDGVYHARATSGNFGILDAAQAEILRGPQGTLFGRNTTGGALNITTVQPTGEYSGYLKASVGNYSAVAIEGAATIPLQGDQLSVRLAGRYGSRNGYGDNPITRSQVGDLDHDWAGRATIKWAPENLPLTFTVAADASSWKDNGPQTSVKALNLPLQPFGPAVPSIGTFFALNGLNPAEYIYKKGVNFDKSYGKNGTGLALVDVPQNNNKQAGVAATLDVELGRWSVKSITAWRKDNSFNSLDFDGTPLRLIDGANRYRQNQYSQELQASTQIGELNFLGGLYYFKEEGTTGSTYANVGMLGSPVGRDMADYASKSRGAFAQANYNFTDRLRGTVGFRYTWDSRSLVRMGISNILVPTSCADIIPLTASGCRQPLNAKFSYPAWTVGIDYKLTENIFAYLKSSGASISGGYNTRPAPLGLQAFNPQEVTDIEAGAKIDLFDKRLRTNIAVYTAHTKDGQSIVNEIAAGRLVQYTRNSGHSRANGVELEVTALPWRGMEVTMAASYLDASYDKGTFRENRGTAAAPLIVDRSGETMPNAPEWAFNLGLTQDFDLSIGRLTAHVDYSYFDDKAISQATAAPGASAATIAAVAKQNQLATIDSYGLVNGRVSLTLDNGVAVSLWGRNLTDEETFTYVFDAYNSLGFTTQFQGPPRTYGVEVKYAF